MDCFLTYVQRFDIVPQAQQQWGGTTAKGSFPDQASSLFVFKRAKRSNMTLIGDILPLCQLRSLVDLIPRFGTTAHRSLTSENCLEYSSEFLLNKYFDKELFWPLNVTSY